MGYFQRRAAKAALRGISRIYRKIVMGKGFILFIELGEVVKVRVRGKELLLGFPDLLEHGVFF